MDMPDDDAAAPAPDTYTLVMRDGRHLTALGTPHYTPTQAVWSATMTAP